jgi:tRNA(Ile)-lysidine synthase
VSWSRGGRRRLPLERAVASALDAPPGVARGEHLLVAASGGPDSTALLVTLAELAPERGLRLTAAYVDHGLRGGESVVDRAVVARVAADASVPLVERRLALAPGSALEARARRARHRALVAMAGEVGASRIVLGHTADDQAETLLLRLLRGAGRGGLAGMRPVRGRLLRPLLGATRADVRHFLADRGVAYALDRSNADLRHARNRVRRLVLPVLAAEFNPGIVRGLAALAGRLRDEESILEALAAERAARLAEGARLHVAVGEEPAALGRRIVRRWLEQGARRGVTAEQVERVLDLARGLRRGAVAIPGPVRVVRERDRLIRRAGREAAASTFCLTVAPGGSAVASGWRLTLSPPGPITTAAVGASDVGPFDGAWAVFDAEALRDGLVVRSRRPGDRIHLPGIGTRKLQDVLVDAKVPREARDALPLVVVAGEIVWVPGVARSAGAAVGPQTRAVVRGVFERAGSDAGAG